MRAIQRAVEICGGQAKLASEIGVTQSRISQFVSGEPIPIRYFPRIARATAGQVTEHELLNDELAKLDATPHCSVA